MNLVKNNKVVKFFSVKEFLISFKILEHLLRVEKKLFNETNLLHHKTGLLRL